MTKSADDVSPASLTVVEPTSLPGWNADDGVLALQTFQRQAFEIQRKGSGFSRSVEFGGRQEDWLPVIRAAASAVNAKPFFTNNFRCFKVADGNRQAGLFTGYYEPLVEGSRVSHPDFPVPILRKPYDLVALKTEESKKFSLKYGRRVGGIAGPYLDRQMIETGALSGRGLEVCWLRDWVDAYFIHIQGSGRVQLNDGTEMRLSYAAKSGLPYTSIGNVLVQRGVLTHDTVSMQTLKAWMNANLHEARSLMWQNKSYIFFREIAVKEPSLGAIGAAQVQLTPRCSIAVDRNYWMFGTPMWLDTTLPVEAGSKPWQRMLIAQDTGSAIKGADRGDIYWGWGEEAAMIAGHMKAQGSLYAFLPHAVADRLGLA